jgi:3-methylcrotonyl-CoA carboxylase beta subunit
MIPRRIKYLPDMNAETLDFNKNEDALRKALSAWRTRLDKIALGGGKAAIDKQREKNKLTARERIHYLVDEGAPFIEIGAFAGYEMYEEQGGCPAGGTVAGIGYVSGRQCIILANDQTVKAGAWFPITGKKNLRLQEMAMENHLPVIYLVDSAGVFLPMQDEIFPDKEHFGRIFRNNARMSAMGITQLAVVMGPCVAGGAYLPIMSDETLMVEGNGSIFLAGPYLVKAAIGEQIDAETLGGAEPIPNYPASPTTGSHRTGMPRPGEEDHGQAGTPTCTPSSIAQHRWRPAIPPKSSMASSRPTQQNPTIWWRSSTAS